MNRNEIVDLLSIVTVYDGRTIGEADVAAWGDAAQRGRWTFEQAQDAVKAHYAESTQWLMPGHVTDRIKVQRRDPPPPHALPPSRRSFQQQHKDSCVAWVRDRLDENASRPSPEDRRAAHAIRCPHCGARADRRCWQTWNGTPLASRKTMEDPHRERIRTARQEQE